MGEIRDDDPELQKVQVLNTKAKEEKTLLDCLSKFFDWRRAVKAIDCLKRYVQQRKGLKPKSNEPKTLKNDRKKSFSLLNWSKRKHSTLRSKV